MATQISVTKSQGTWVVRAGGAVLGESKNALELSEGDYPAVIYFPRSDIAMAFLDQAERTSFCPHKGDATYFNIVTKSQVIENAGWSYESPLDSVSAIAGHIAFYNNDLVAVEQL